MNNINSINNIIEIYSKSTETKPISELNRDISSLLKGINEDTVKDPVYSRLLHTCSKIDKEMLKQKGDSNNTNALWEKIFQLRSEVTKTNFDAEMEAAGEYFSPSHKKAVENIHFEAVLKNWVEWGKSRGVQLREVYQNIRAVYDGKSTELTLSKGQYTLEMEINYLLPILSELRGLRKLTLNEYLLTAFPSGSSENAGKGSLWWLKNLTDLSELVLFNCGLKDWPTEINTIKRHPRLCMAFTPLLKTYTSIIT